MKKMLLVAKWEFTTTVARRAYIFAVVAMPVFYGGMFLLAGIAGRSASANVSRAPVAVVDHARIVDLAFASAQAAARDARMPPAPDDPVTQTMSRRSPASAAMTSAVNPPRSSLVAYGTLDSALDALAQQRVAGVFEIAADYMSSGAITSYTRNSGLFAQTASRQRETQLASAIRASLMRPLPADTLARAYAPTTTVAHKRVTASGVEDDPDSTGLGAIAGSFGVFLLLTMAIFFSAGFLQQATIADRQNRMIEILLSSVDPDELLLGKMLGLGGAGLLQVLIYVTLIIVPGSALLSVFQVSVAKLALSVVFFVLGYLLFAALMTGTGMIGRTAQESAQMSTIWILAASAPWFFIANIGAAPNGPLARMLSFIPLTSPITMMMRISSVEVPPLEIALAVAVDAAAIYLAIRGSAKIFRAAALMYGKRATLPELVRWLRAA
jgi:ABC-2 type transport system permease protein